MLFKKLLNRYNKKRDMILKVSYKPKWIIDEDVTLVINTCDKNGFKIEKYILEEFNELSVLDLYENIEGEIVYYGSLSIDEMIQQLKELGFNAIYQKKL